MKKIFLVTVSLLVASLSFSAKGGTSSSSAPAATISHETKSGVSDSFEDFGKLPSAPSLENRMSELSEKFSSQSKLSKTDKKEIKREIKSEIKKVKNELKSDKNTELDPKWAALLLLTVFIPLLSALWYYLQYGNEKPFKLILWLSILGLITFGLTLLVAWIITIVNFVQK